MAGRRVPATALSGPRLDFPDRCLPDLVVAAARDHPDAMAVRQWADRLSYADLSSGAAGIAARLSDLGVRPEDVVAVCTRRRPYLVTALLGVLRSGAAYLPLDPSLPPARLRALITDAGARVLVADTDGAARLAGSGCRLVEVPAASESTVDGPPCPAHPMNPAYVMYTSGSTGTPKGVVVPHRALTQFVTGLVAGAGLGRQDVSIAFASVGFDVSIIDLLAPLVVGGSIALAGESDRTDPARLQRFCEEHGVTFGDLPPAILPLLDPAPLPHLRLLLTGSEAPGPEQVARWATPHRRFLNCYGPTETTVQVTAFEATGEWDQPLPIGVPLPNQRVHVVDEEFRQVGIGVPGELLVGGPGLARGYLGAGGLTAERFVPDPFAANPGARLYRTGDLVVWQPDGTLMFLGRLDRQVKIRGQRVETGEVEAVLRGHPAVRHAVVDVVPGPSGPQLVAYVAPADPPPDPAALREHCALRLPAVMVPAIRLVPDLPLGPTGKVDLDRLRELATPAGEPERPAYAAPVTDEEKAVAAAWTELLGGDRAGRDDDFFDSGGHSITAMRLVAALRARLGRDVAIEDVLGGRTLATIAARVAAAPALDPEPALRGRPPALSPAQRRLWFLDRYAPEAAAAYNIGFAERLRGPLDVDALRAALGAVVARQEVLRWRIPDTAGVPYAVVDNPGDVPLPVEPVSEAELAERLAAQARERFDLATDRLWRAALYRLGEDDHVLAVTAHHAVFDGWSQTLLYEDLAAAYRFARRRGRADLPPLAATYADYVAWREQRLDPRAEPDLRWWLDHLDGVPTVLELPGDRPRPAEQTFRGAYARTELDAATTAAAHAVARSLGATPSALLLAALGLVMARLTGATDMVIGSPTVDRRHVDFEEMIGFFIEIAPLRLRVDEQSSFGEHVRRARDELMAALAHPEAPLDRIVDALGLGGELSRSPLAQVLFNMFNFAAPELELPGVEAEPVPVEVPGSPFDLTVYGVERADRLTIELVYNPDLFDAPRMEALLDGLRAVLVQGIGAPAMPVRELTMPAGVPVAAGPPVGVPLAKARATAAAPVRVAAEPPGTPTEKAVAAVWCDVLGLAGVGTTETFFDVGGGSLAIVAVQHRLNERLGRRLRVVDLFRYPTVRALAAYLDGSAGGDDLLDRAARRGAARRDRGRRRPDGQSR